MAEGAGDTERSRERKRVPVERSVAISGEGAARNERVVVREGTDRTERPATSVEGAAASERADPVESAEILERPAERCESAASAERAETPESAESEERLAKAPESAGSTERPAELPESAGSEERPKYRLGYPRIESPSHHLWDAQQAGWPDHAAHFAWRDLVSGQRREDQPKASSSDHPAFGASYVPNYVATQEKPSEAYEVRRPEKARR